MAPNIPHITIKETNLAHAVEIHFQIPEFTEITDKFVFEERLKGKKSLCLLGLVGKREAAYLMAYDRYGDGSFYCWLAGVIPEFRRLGIFTHLMDYLENWARKEGYQKITIKTRNQRRETLSYLTKNGYNFIHVQPKGRVEENRILAEKNL